MGKGDNKLMRKRLANAYMSSVVSISLVLLLVGVACLLLLNAKKMSDFFKENMEVSVIMKPGVAEDQAMAFLDTLKGQNFVRSATFVSREQGELELKEMLGEDFLDVFEASPVPVSIDMTLKASYVSSDSLEAVSGRIMRSELVEDVNYQKVLVDSLNSNLRNLSLILAVFIALLMFVSYVLINNTVRISVFARRFTIHTMKLVGATKSFIRKPFLIRAAIQGLVAAVIANGVLYGLLAFLQSRFGQVMSVLSAEILAVVVLVVFVSGLLICLISTYFVVNKLVALEKDQLYF